MTWISSETSWEPGLCNEGVQTGIAEPRGYWSGFREDVTTSEGDGIPCPQNRTFEFPIHFTYSKMVLVWG